VSLVRVVYGGLFMTCNRIDRGQRKFVRYALRGLGWMDMYDLP
jgi:hypothetical protein